MMKSPSLIALSLLATTTGLSVQAQAAVDNIALDFSLPDAVNGEANGVPALATASSEPPLEDEVMVAADAPLPIPPNAANPPISRAAVALPSSVYRGNAQALSAQVEGFSAALPPAPPTMSVPAVAVAETPPAEVVAAQVTENKSPIALSFAFGQPNADATQKAEIPTPEPTRAVALSSTDFAQAMEAFVFEGGRNSLVARAIGSAEGTRTPLGDYTRAFNGHVDPGNQAWNLGTFSYQHGANSPEEADYKQLERLQSQAKIIQQKAEARGLTLDLAQTLNALDLANQSPLAALGKGGYMDRLVEAQAKGLEGEAAILWSRTYAYFDSDRQRWNAPGLGNTFQGVNRDQQRRMNAVASAMDTVREVPAELAQAAIASPTSTPAANPEISPNAEQPIDLNDPVDQFIALDFDLPPKSEMTAIVPVAATNAPVSAASNLEASSLEATSPAVSGAPLDSAKTSAPKLVSASPVPEVRVLLPDAPTAIVEGQALGGVAPSLESVVLTRDNGLLEEPPLAWVPSGL